MFGLEGLSTETIGVLSSFVASLFALAPFFGATTSRRALTAIVVIVVFTLAKDGFQFESVEAFAGSIMTASVYAVAMYKLLLQPVVTPVIEDVAHYFSPVAAAAPKKKAKK